MFAFLAGLIAGLFFKETIVLIYQVTKGLIEKKAKDIQKEVSNS